jgi:uncharacterized linocin/CFP29 family protein
MAELNWSDAQWQKVNDSIAEAFGKASVASAFLPCYGPLPGSAETVRNERLEEDRTSRPTTIRLDGDHDTANLKLINLTVNVLLSSEQIADETLANATFAFRRAANILAQEEDRIVFEGFGRGFPNDDSPIVVNKVEPQPGLADLPARRKFSGLNVPKVSLGQAVVSAVVKAIHELEDNSHPAPFACVLGNTLFDGVYEPSRSLALPADRITPLLKGGPLLRSGKMGETTGIVVSLAGNAVDLVVGTPPTAQFLQRQRDAKFLFRVYERFVLRIRDKARPPVAGFRIQPGPGDRTSEANRLRLVRDAANAQKAVRDL